MAFFFIGIPLLESILSAETDLFKLARQSFGLFTQKLEVYGVQVDPTVELRHGTGMFCYYDFLDGHIYLSLPDLTAPAGKLHLFLLRSLIGFEDDEAVFQLLTLFTPYILAHELAHHLRHRLGLFGANFWEEEQIANQLAAALTKHLFSPDQKRIFQAALQKAATALGEAVGGPENITGSYRDWLSALRVTGEINRNDFKNLELLHKLFDLAPATALIDNETISPEAFAGFQKRADLIQTINERYGKDYLGYLGYHFGWLHLEFSSHDSEYVDAFIRQHLHQPPNLLQKIATLAGSDTQICACFQAYQLAQSRSKTAGAYFYKRYRSLLLARWRATPAVLPTHRSLHHGQALLEGWSEQETDLLVYLTQVAPAHLRQLFPGAIAKISLSPSTIGRDLPTDTDRRVWQWVMFNVKDQSAANTLHHLEWFERTPVFRGLAAETLFELADNVCVVKLLADETLFWEGETNDDVYLLTKGELAAYGTDKGVLHQKTILQPGALFGEIEFFTRQPRKVTVRARTFAECFAWRASDLQLMALQHPAILFQLAKTLAEQVRFS